MGKRSWREEGRQSCEHEKVWDVGCKKVRVFFICQNVVGCVQMWILGHLSMQELLQNHFLK